MSRSKNNGGRWQAYITNRGGGWWSPTDLGAGKSKWWDKRRTNKMRRREAKLLLYRALVVKQDTEDVLTGKE